MADFVYICADPDREGEAIAWSLRKFLKIPKDKYKRVTFHEITKSAVLKAFDNPRDIDEELVNSAQSRQCLDKMLGYRISPIARKVLGAKSVGRCQSAGLKLIVDREMEIKNFVPKEYGELTLNFIKNDKQFKAKYYGSRKEIKQSSYQHCEEVKTECEKINNYYVDNVVQKDRISNPKPPFTTSTFQQEVSSKLGVGVKDAMKYAQQLFEGLDVNGKHIALITYIRTDSTEMSEEFKVVLESYVKSTYGDKYYSPIKKIKKGENVQDGHEAIRPVDLNMTTEKLSKYIDNRTLLKVYDIIYRRTVATMMSNSITSETTYEIVNGKHQFNLVSKELVFDGYQKVYNYKEQDEDVVDITFEKDEIINNYNPSLILIRKETTPPSRYKESTFIKELENTGIGRPSTFATILNTLIDKSRGYCDIVDKCIVPTEKGIELSKYLDESFSNLINVNYTSELEKELDLISKGKLSKLDFLNSFYNKLEETVKSANKTKKNVNTEKIEADCVCPQCGSKMYLRTSKFGQFYGCSKYPKCKCIVNINKESEEKKEN